MLLFYSEIVKVTTTAAAEAEAVTKKKRFCIRFHQLNVEFEFIIYEIDCCISSS